MQNIDFNNLTADDIRNIHDNDIRNLTEEQQLKYGEALVKYTMLLRTMNEPSKVSDILSDFEKYKEHIDNGACIEVRIKDENGEVRNVLKSSTFMVIYDNRTGKVVLQNYV